MDEQNLVVRVNEAHKAWLKNVVPDLFCDIMQAINDKSGWEMRQTIRKLIEERLLEGEGEDEKA